MYMILNPYASIKFQSLFVKVLSIRWFFCINFSPFFVILEFSSSFGAECMESFARKTKHSSPFFVKVLRFERPHQGEPQRIVVGGRFPPIRK